MTLSTTLLVHPRDHSFLIRNLLQNNTKSEDEGRRYYTGKTTGALDFKRKVLLCSLETDPEYCDDRITVKGTGSFQEELDPKPKEQVF